MSPTEIGKSIAALGRSYNDAVRRSFVVSEFLTTTA